MRSMAVRKAEERKQLQVRVNDTLKECNKMKEEEQKCQRQIDEIKRQLATEKVNKVQLQTNQKRTSLEMQKLRECVKNMTKEKEDLESQYDQLQRENSKLLEQEVDLKNERNATTENLKKIEHDVAKIKSELEEAEIEKRAFLEECGKQLADLEVVRSSVVGGELNYKDEEDVYSSIQGLQGTAPPVVALPSRAMTKKKRWFRKNKNVD